MYCIKSRQQYDHTYKHFPNISMLNGVTEGHVEENVQRLGVCKYHSQKSLRGNSFRVRLLLLSYTKYCSVEQSMPCDNSKEKGLMT